MLSHEILKKWSNEVTIVPIVLAEMLFCIYIAYIRVSIYFTVLFFYDWIWPLQTRRTATCLWGRTSVFYWRTKGMLVDMSFKENQVSFNNNKIIVGCKYFDLQITVKVLKIKSFLLKCVIDLNPFYKYQLACEAWNGFVRTELPQTTTFISVWNLKNN